jgi:hypothetical protein
MYKLSKFYTNNLHDYRNELHELKPSYWREVREDNKIL